LEEPPGFVLRPVAVDSSVRPVHELRRRVVLSRDGAVVPGAARRDLMALGVAGDRHLTRRTCAFREDGGAAAAPVRLEARGTGVRGHARRLAAAVVERRLAGAALCGRGAAGYRDGDAEQHDGVEWIEKFSRGE